MQIFVIISDSTISCSKKIEIFMDMFQFQKKATEQ